MPSRLLQLENVLFFRSSSVAGSKGPAGIHAPSGGTSSVGASGILKLIDFGLAAHLHAAATPAPADSESVVTGGPAAPGSPARDEALCEGSAATSPASTLPAAAAAASAAHHSHSSVSTGAHRAAQAHAAALLAASIDIEGTEEAAVLLDPTTPVAAAAATSVSPATASPTAPAYSAAESLAPLGKRERLLQLVCGSLMYTPSEILACQPYQGRPAGEEKERGVLCVCVCVCACVAIYAPA